MPLANLEHKILFYMHNQLKESQHSCCKFQQKCQKSKSNFIGIAFNLEKLFEAESLSLDFNIVLKHFLF